jgi:hypothetical protein
MTVSIDTELSTTEPRRQTCVELPISIVEERTSDGRYVGLIVLGAGSGSPEVYRTQPMKQGEAGRTAEARCRQRLAELFAD